VPLAFNEKKLTANNEVLIPKARLTERPAKVRAFNEVSEFNEREMDGDREVWELDDTTSEAG
jgi:hypothetical protein